MTTKKTTLALALVVALSAAGMASAHFATRHYYSSWTYYPAQSYHYCYYYYKPTPVVTTYSYHYAIVYPTQPRYVNYYNPYQQQYWGRLDTQAKGDKQYSLLAENDRKKELKDIPEKAFPALDKMPAIPESTDGEQMLVPKELPKIDVK